MDKYNSPPAKRSAVIISQNGEVEECIDIDDPGANEISFSELDDSGSDDDPKHKSRFTTWLLISSFIVFIAVTIFIYLGAPNIPIPDAAHFITKRMSNSIQEPIENLKQKATFVIQDNLSNVKYIDSFIYEWNQLSQSVKKQFTASFWLERYTSLLEEKISFIKGSKSSTSDNTLEYIDKLKKMASLIKIEDVAKIIESPNIEKDFAEIFKAISTDITKVEVEQKNTNRTNEKRTDKKIARTSTKGFSESDVNYLLGQYATTYEFGSTDKIMKYFSVKNEYKRQLIKSFDKVFVYSANRHIVFSDLTWTFYKNSIIGNGKYKAKLELKDNKGTRFIDAQIQLKMRVKSKRLRIAKLKFSNVKVNLVPVKFPAQPVSTVKKKTPKPKVYKQPIVKASKQLLIKVSKFPVENSSKHPTEQELRDVITRFISAYESGNLVALNSIFSKNAKTNDNHNLRGIKQDYMALFSTTTDRRMIIENLNWSYQNNLAQAIGRLSVLTVRRGTNKLNSQFGDIQIAAQKSNNKVTITHLFHNLNEK